MKLVILSLLVLNFTSYSMEQLELNHKLFQACLGPKKVDKEIANLTEISNLLEQKADINALCTTGPLGKQITPLIQTLYGCCTGKANRIAFLLNKHANVEAVDEDNDNALTHALRQYVTAPLDQQGEYFKIIKSLLLSGSRVTDDSLTLIDQFIDHTIEHPHNSNLRKLLISSRSTI